MPLRIMRLGASVLGADFLGGLTVESALLNSSFPKHNGNLRGPPNATLPKKQGLIRGVLKDNDG